MEGFVIRVKSIEKRNEEERTKKTCGLGWGAVSGSQCFTELYNKALYILRRQTWQTMA
jgi:hypothetical protein